MVLTEGWSLVKVVFYYRKFYWISSSPSWYNSHIWKKEKKKGCIKEWGETTLTTCSSTVLRATGNKKLKEQVAVELSFFNSNIQLLKEELSEMNSSVEIYQHDKWVFHCPVCLSVASYSLPVERGTAEKEYFGGLMAWSQHASLPTCLPACLSVSLRYKHGESLAPLATELSTARSWTPPPRHVFIAMEPIGPAVLPCCHYTWVSCTCKAKPNLAVLGPWG